MQPRLDCALGGAREISDLGDRQAAEVVQNDRLPLPGRQAGQGGLQGDPVRRWSRDRPVGARVVNAVCRRVRRQRLVARFQATLRTQAAGSSYVETLSQRGRARLNASCTTSWASVIDPVWT